MSVKLKFDGDDSKSSARSYTFARKETGSIYADDDAVLESNSLGTEGTYRNDAGTLGTGIYASEAPPDLDLVERFGSPEGNRGQTVEMTLISGTVSQGWALKYVMFKAAPTQNRYVGDV